MEFRQLTNGERMPALGFGTWQLTGKQATSSVEKAIRIGYRHIDTAQIYENEYEVGLGIKASGITRNQLFVTTKVWTEHFTRDKVLASTDESLRRLGMDYVNLLLMHWPNDDVPMSETLGALQEVLKAGKTRAIGVSNFPVAKMKEALETLKAPIVCNQVEYHVMLSQKPVIDYAGAHGLVVTAYSPLGRGKLMENAVLERIGKQYGKTPQQVALRWLIEQPNVAAIPKAASEDHARANFEIFDFKLSAADMKAIEALGGDKRLVNPAWAPRWDNAA